MAIAILIAMTAVLIGVLTQILARRLRLGDDILLHSTATLGLLFAHLVMIASCMVVARRRGGMVQSLALAAPSGGLRAYCSAIVLFLVVATSFAVASALIYGRRLSDDMATAALSMIGPHWPLAALVFGITAPISEEVLFRGFLHTALTSGGLGFAPAALLSTFLWTVMHIGYSPFSLAEVFAIGLFLSWIRWRDGSIRVTLLCHMAYNCGLLLALRFALLTM